MDLFDAEILAKSLIAEYNPGVHFQWSRRKNAYGDYRVSTNTMRLSNILTKMRPEYEVRNTIMHEIAHSLTPGDKHGWHWRAQMRAFGLEPKVCSTTVADLTQIPRQWYGICPAGHKTSGGWHRKPTANRSCGKCSRSYNPAYRLRYVQY